MARRRKATFSLSDKPVISLPQVSTMPLVGLRMPAMIEIRVVLPHPEGPTSMVSSPAGTSKSIPCNTSASPSPVGKDLVTLVHLTAIDRSLIATTPETQWRGPPPSPCGYWQDSQ